MRYVAIGHDDGIHFKTRQEVVDKLMEKIKENIEDYNEDQKDFSLLFEIMQSYCRVFGDTIVNNGILKIDFNKLVKKYTVILKNEDRLFEEWDFWFDGSSKYGYELEGWEGNKRVR